MAALVAAIIIVRIVLAVVRFSGRGGHPHVRLLEMGNEREEFWLPGDPDPFDDSDDFED